MIVFLTLFFNKPLGGGAGIPGGNVESSFQVLDCRKKRVLVQRKPANSIKEGPNWS